MLINMSLVRPRNLIVIMAITTLAHIVAKPLYTAVDNSGASS